jgi:SAM-dependent methyltransferase
MKRAVNPGEIVWRDAAHAESISVACPVCGHPGPHVAVLGVPSLAPPHVVLTLFECSGCASGFYDPPGITDFSDLDQDREDFWRFYVEVGGGVWETIWPLLVDVVSNGRTLLDVGCGFGFAVDFWGRTTGAEAIGVELADYGATGARMLDIPVHREFVQDCRALAGRRFDIVYASEVVEHVPDPRAFVALLARFVADDGVLVLTTPCIDYVTPANASATLLAALAPGFHGFLMSPAAFAEAARRAGFGHVETRTFGERQMLWASREARRLDFSFERMRAPYLAYLESWYRRGDHASSLWHGYAYRLIRDLINAGRFAEAKPKADALLEALKEAYGEDIADPRAMAAKIGRAGTLVEFGEAAPFFLPCLYYALASLAQHHDGGDLAAARRYYRGAADIGVDCARLGALFFLEATSLVWPARVMEAGLDLAQGQPARAAATFVRLARDGRRCDAADGYALASPEYIESVVPRACESLAFANAWDAARGVFSAYREYLQGTYPYPDATSRATLDAALAGTSEMDRPRDPAFAYFFQSLLDTVAGNGDVARERLEALAALAAAHRDHPTQGARLVHYAEVAQRYAPARTLFEYSVTIPASATRRP